MTFRFELNVAGFDELVVDNAFVHIERMSDEALSINVSQNGTTVIDGFIVARRRWFRGPHIFVNVTAHKGARITRKGEE